MDKSMSTRPSGEILSASRQLTAEQQRLKAAIEATLRARNTRTGIILVSFPEELYFIERTLIELGYLKGRSTMSAYKEFSQLLSSLDIQLPERLHLTKHDHRHGTHLITNDPFPWKVSATTDPSWWPRCGSPAENNEADLPRWQMIYTFLSSRLS